MAYISILSDCCGLYASIVILVVKKLADMKGIALRTVHLLLVFVFVFLLFFIIL